MNALDLRKASAGLFLLSMGVLLLEMSLTRVFSVMSWHHFAYLIISLALLGFGAASTFLTVSPRFAHEGVVESLVARYAIGFSVSSILGFALATKVRFHPIDIVRYGDFSNLFSLLLIYLLVGVPFYFAGVCIGYLLSRAGDGVNRLYFFDLLGAGSGALLSIAGVNYLGAEATIYVAATAGALTAVLYARAGTWRSRLGASSALGLSLLMAVAATNFPIFPVYFPPEKDIHPWAMEPHYYRWNVLARVDVLNPVPFLFDFGGQLSPLCNDEMRRVPTRAVFQDGGAGTGIVNLPGGDPNSVQALKYYLQGAPYVIKPSANHALIIGVGGGIDVLIALYHHTRRITGVEVNPVIADAVKHRYADFAGRVFDRPDVELITAEGRHYLSATRDQFDVIQLSGVDSFVALSSGAYALSENYLYTIEAMHDFWNHLTPDGVLSFSRCLFTPPRETLRLVAIELEAMDRMGVERPDRHLMVISAGDMAETLLKRSEFTRTEVAAYRSWADRLQFRVRYDPFRAGDDVFDQLIRSSTQQRARMIESYPFDIHPTSDDDPFFFHLARWRSLLNPPEAEASVQEWADWQFPLSFAILLASLGQILIMSTALIIGPLLLRTGRLRGVSHKGRVLVYFSTLGLGFITVEIALLQKYAVFVGGPVYAMAVTLFAILVFSGIGSLLARRIALLHPRSLTVALVALVGAIVGEAVFVSEGVPKLMFLSHGLRCVVTVAALAPLAMLMGMPFPMGLRVAQRLGQTIVPWAWGVNAVTTTLGSLLCVMVSMEWGFRTSLLGAAMMYLIAMLTALDGLHAGNGSGRPAR